MSLLPPSHALAPSRHSLSRVHRRAAEAGSGPSGGGGTIHTTDEAGGETGRTRPVMSDARNRADRVDGADGADAGGAALTSGTFNNDVHPQEVTAPHRDGLGVSRCCFTLSTPFNKQHVIVLLNH